MNIPVFQDEKLMRGHVYSHLNICFFVLLMEIMTLSCENNGVPLPNSRWHWYIDLFSCLYRFCPTTSWTLLIELSLTPAKRDSPIILCLINHFTPPM